MASEAKILQLIARVALFTVESTMNLTYRNVMRSCYRPGKIISKGLQRFSEALDNYFILYTFIPVV